MSKRLLYLFVHLSIYLSGKGQVNLVPNYSFEDTVGVNCFYQMLIETPLSGGNIFTRNWFTYKNMSTDFYNYCSNTFTSSHPYPNGASIPLNCYGYQSPHTGDSYIGMGLYLPFPDSVNHNVELAVTKLQHPLKVNTCYYGEMHYSLSNISGVTINQLGMLFTQSTNTLNPFVFDNTSKYQIQSDTNTFLSDTVGWTKISGTFMAQGGEQYLTGTSSANYVYVDDISLYELPNHTGTQSYTLCAGDSLLLGDTINLPVRYQWSLNGVVVDTTKNIMVGANGYFGSAQWPVGANSITVVLQTKHCTTQTQTITIVVDKNCNPTDALEVPNVFTPNGDGVNDVFEFSLPKNGALSGAEVKSFNVFNRWGNSVHELEAEALEASNGGGNNGSGTSSASVTTIIWDGRTTSGTECSAGVYFYVLEYRDANGDVKKKNGYISLIR